MTVHRMRSSGTVLAAASTSGRRRFRLFATLPAIVLAAVTLVAVAGTAAGDLYPGFGSGGKVLTDFGAGRDDAFGLALQPDGRIVAPGFSDAAGNYDFALARYLGCLPRTVRERGC